MNNSAEDLWSLIEYQSFQGWLSTNFDIEKVPPTLRELATNLKKQYDIYAKLENEFNSLLQDEMNED